MKRNIQGTHNIYQLTRSLIFLTLDAAQTKRLINELQQIAKDVGHAKPLLIGTDQENGKSLSTFLDTD